MNANGRTLVRIYSRLHGHEAAVLAFGAIAASDEAAAEHVALTVSPAERPAYRFRLEGCYRLAGCYGIQHHKLRARLLAAIGARLYYARDEAKGQPAQDARQHWAACLVALEDALHAVCEPQGIDAEAVRSMAEAEDVDRSFPPEPAFRQHAEGMLAAALGE